MYVTKMSKSRISTISDITEGILVINMNHGVRPYMNFERWSGRQS